MTDDPTPDPRQRPSGAAYAGVAAAVAAATLARVALDPVLGNAFPHTTYFATAALVAGFGRTRPAALALVAGGLLGTFLFVPPRYTLHVPDTNALLGLGLYLLIGSVVVAMSHALRAARRRAEGLLAVARASEANYRLLVEGNPALICRFRPDGTLTFVNDTYCRTFGKSRDELVGRAFAPLIPDEDRHVAAALMARLAPGMEPVTDQHRAVVAGGGVRWQRWTNQAVTDDTGAFTGEYQAVGIDITDRMRAEEALQAADRRKDEFLATLAHELRNPLAPVRTGLHLLGMAGTDAAKAATVRGMMERQLTQLVRLVDDLMDVSRISRGRVELRRERVTLAAVIDSAVEASRPLIERMGHRLAVTLPAEPVVLDADLTRLAQVVSNLLNNAAKYSDAGGDIRLTAARDGGDAVVSVRDAGIGIPPDRLTAVFELFAQVDGAGRRAQGGLGIGLSLVKRLVELHGGTVEARSDGPGTGAEFVVRLPAVVS